MKILHVITTLDIGGAERLMVDLLPLLNQGENQVDLLLFNGVDTPFKNELKEKGVRILQLTSWKGIKNHFEVYNPLNIFRLKPYISDYDIVHTHNTACQYYVSLAAKLCKRPILVTTEHSTFNRRRSLKWFKPIDKWMYDKYSAVICISDQASANLKEYIGAPEKIHTILNGVNVDRFYRSSKEISRNSSFLISMIAAFRKEKDHETMLRAMSHLPVNYKLQLAGRDFDEKVPTLKQMCIDLGIQDRVDFLGARSDVPDLLEESDVVVMSSHWEGFGLAAVEAMAAGRPLIASDVGGLRDIVQDGGLLFPQGDDKELAQRIQFLCEHPDEYHEVAKQCRNKAQQYDISKMAEKYLGLYESLL